MQIKVKTLSVSETKRIARKFSEILQAGDIICLYGDLGSGKTTFVKGLANHFRVKQKDVCSPTFVLMHIYDGKIPLYHFDLYRLDDVEDLYGLGLDEFLFDERGLSLIEWSERLKTLKPKACFTVELAHKGDHQRVLQIKASGQSYQKRLKQFSKSLSDS